MRSLIFLVAAFYSYKSAAQITCDTIAKIQASSLVSVNSTPLFSAKKISLLDFEQRRICDISNEITSEILSKGFHEIESSFNKHGFYIFITIRKKKYAFDFDTSFTGSFSMKFSNDLPIIK